MSNHIIAKLITHQVADLQENQVAEVTFLLKSPDRHQRGRFERLKVTFSSSGGAQDSSSLLNIHFDHTDVDGKPVKSRAFYTERNAHDMLAVILNDKKIFDLEGEGLVYTTK